MHPPREHAHTSRYIILLGIPAGPRLRSSSEDPLVPSVARKMEAPFLPKYTDVLAILKPVSGMNFVYRCYR